MPAIAGFVPAPIPRRLRHFWHHSPLVLGLLAALVAWNDFPGRQIWRGVLLFPYIVPMVAVAFVQ